MRYLVADDSTGINGVQAGSDESDLTAVSHYIDKIISLAILILALLAALFVAVFWKKPVIVLSQRWHLMCIIGFLMLDNMGTFFGSSTTAECFYNKVLSAIGFSGFYATLGAKELQAFFLDRSIKRYSFKPLSKVYPILYIVFWVALCTGAAIFAWLIPYSNSGVKPCDIDPSEYQFLSVHDRTVSKMYSYTLLVNHLCAFVIGTLSWRCRSVMGDALAVFILSLLGVVYVSVNLISYAQTDLETKNKLRISANIIDCLIQVMALWSLVFNRCFYLNYSAEAIVKLYLHIGIREYNEIEERTTEDLPAHALLKQKWCGLRLCLCCDTFCRFPGRGRPITHTQHFPAHAPRPRAAIQTLEMNPIESWSVFPTGGLASQQLDPSSDADVASIQIFVA